jgi:hypothetical protein
VGAAVAYATGASTTILLVPVRRLRPHYPGATWLNSFNALLFIRFGGTPLKGTNDGN